MSREVSINKQFVDVVQQLAARHKIAGRVAFETQGYRDDSDPRIAMLPSINVGLIEPKYQPFVDELDQIWGEDQLRLIKHDGPKKPLGIVYAKTGLVYRGIFAFRDAEAIPAVIRKVEALLMLKDGLGNTEVLKDKADQKLETMGLKEEKSRLPTGIYDEAAKVRESVPKKRAESDLDEIDQRVLAHLNRYAQEGKPKWIKQTRTVEYFELVRVLQLFDTVQKSITDLLYVLEWDPNEKSAFTRMGIESLYAGRLYSNLLDPEWNLTQTASTKGDVVFYRVSDVHKAIRNHKICAELRDLVSLPMFQTGGGCLVM